VDVVVSNAYIFYLVNDPVKVRKMVPLQLLNNLGVLSWRQWNSEANYPIEIIAENTESWKYMQIIKLSQHCRGMFSRFRKEFTNYNKIWRHHIIAPQLRVNSILLFLTSGVKFSDILTKFQLYRK
jgi:hypothetical protein